MALAAKLAKKHLLLEGDVGVGKTTLAHAIANYFSLDLERVDGDDRYSAARLVGHFDPPMVMQKGYSKIIRSRSFSQFNAKRFNVIPQ